MQNAAKLEVAIQGVEATNRKISQNNTYKQLQSKITLLPLPPKPEDDISQAQQESKVLNTENIELQKTVKDADAFVQKIAKLSGTCPTCLQPIDTHKISELVNEQTSIKTTAESKIKLLRERMDILNVEYKNHLAKKSAWESAQKSQDEWEKYHQLIDTELPEIILDKATLQTELETLQTSIQDTRAKIALAEKSNQQVSAHNSKVDTISKQLAEMSEELETYSAKLHELSERMSIVNVLTKTFSTTGLVAYKIECLVKDLEEITNSYLVDLSDGRFQISFKISASDKLNVVITDNGRDIEMLALSGGERARVNVATLLAIRKLMQTLSSSRINLLILDETVEALDVDGKEKLVEVLLGEEHLNTFLVSHGFSHPLLEKVNVVKRNNISHIEV
jgi:DNA repair exonuclease SbcCD ATPase subunit